MKGLIITTAAIAISVASLMSQSGQQPTRRTTVIGLDHSWTSDYHFDKSTNLWM
jgi:hypothetical protein